jgi:ferredoxin/flavodoxin
LPGSAISFWYNPWKGWVSPFPFHFSPLGAGKISRVLRPSVNLKIHETRQLLETERPGMMKTTIFHFTGTGNSLWVARTLAQELGDAELASLPDWKPGKTIDANVIGLVFPVHIWGVPHRILQFVKELEGKQADYVFAIAVNAGQFANTLVQLKKILSESGLNLAAGFEITMPSNYIPWGGPGSKEKQNQRFDSARKKISGIVAAIRAKNRGTVEKGPLWQRVLFTLIYKVSFPQIPKMDKKFWADEKCNGCSVCARLCPSANIILQGGKPTWNHRCEQCFACLQWCPQQAIQYGKKTLRYERYHHPEVRLQEILKQGLSPE